MKKMILALVLIGMIIQCVVGQVVLSDDFQKLGLIKIQAPMAKVDILSKINVIDNVIDFDKNLFLSPNIDQNFSHKTFYVFDNRAQEKGADILDQSSPMFPQEFLLLFQTLTDNCNVMLQMNGWPNIFMVKCYDQEIWSVQVYWNSETSRWDLRVNPILGNEQIFYGPGCRLFLTQTLLE